MSRSEKIGSEKACKTPLIDIELSGRNIGEHFDAISNQIRVPTLTGIMPNGTCSLFTFDDEAYANSSQRRVRVGGMAPCHVAVEICSGHASRSYT